MSETLLFTFGCLIFFITLTGAFIYGMFAMREFADRTAAEGRETAEKIRLEKEYNAAKKIRDSVVDPA